MIDPLNGYWVILRYFDLWFTPILYLLNQGTFSLWFPHLFYKFNTHCMSLLTISQVLILLSSVCHCHVCFHSKSTISWQQKHDRTLKSQQNRQALQSVVLSKQVWPCILANELNQWYFNWTLVLGMNNIVNCSISVRLTLNDTRLKLYVQNIS